MSLNPSESTFKCRFCKLTGVPPEKYEETLFRKAMHWHARLIAPLLLRWRPELFEEDLGVIRELSEVDSKGLFSSEVNRFYGRNRRDKSFLRNTLLVRVSGENLHKWKDRCFNASP